MNLAVHMRLTHASCNQLGAHQFGVMVGMRAALAHVLGLFTPDQLEKRLGAAGG